MKKTIITVPARPRDLRKVLFQLSGKPFSWVYLGQSVVEFRQAKEIFAAQGTFVDTTSRFHEASETLRKPYLAFVYHIGRKLNSLRWWTTSLAYRTGLVSKTFHRACYLKVALDLVQNWKGEEHLVVVAENSVRRALKLNLSAEDQTRVRSSGQPFSTGLGGIGSTLRMLAHRAFLIYREAMKIYRTRRLVTRPPAPMDGTTLVISWVTADNLRDGEEFYRSYFGDLPSRLLKLGCNVSILPMILRNIPYEHALLKLRDSTIPLYFPHSFLTLRDLISTVITSLFRPSLPRSMPMLHGMNIRFLVEEEVRRNWVTNYAVDALLLAALLRSWAKLGYSIERVIYIYENQGWERSLCWEARRSFPGIKLVGYQHSRVPRRLLNFYMAPGGESEAPLPDRVVTVGKYTSRLLSGDGYEPVSVRVGGALQVQNIRSPNRQETAGVGNNTILVASGIGSEETAELVDIAVNLFNENDDITVVIKCHPLMPLGQAGVTNLGDFPKNVQISDEPITRLMQTSSLMIYTSSTVCIQALAHGLPLVQLRCQFDFDVDPLEAAPDVRLTATGLEDLRQKVRWLLNHREEYIALHKDEWDRLIDEYYGPVTENSYQAFLE